MRNRDKKARPIEGGLACPKCRAVMQRYEHSPNWKPLPGKYWFRFWDRCLPCQHVQHYHEAFMQAEAQ